MFWWACETEFHHVDVFVSVDQINMVIWLNCFLIIISTQRYHSIFSLKFAYEQNVLILKFFPKFQNSNVFNSGFRSFGIWFFKFSFIACLDIWSYSFYSDCKRDSRYFCYIYVYLLSFFFIGYKFIPLLPLVASRLLEIRAVLKRKNSLWFK